MNYVFIGIFSAEVIIKFFGLGYKLFVQDRYNIFDTVVMFISLIELIFLNNSGSITALRAFRLLRIFKIFKAGPLRVLIDSLIKTLRSISPFVICLGIIMYIFVLVAMQFFAGKVKFDSDNKVDTDTGSSPRYNFDTFSWSSITVFSILVGDNWNVVMYNTVRATEEYFVIYFMIVIIVGNIAMLQLFVAIMIDNFTQARKISEKRKIVDEIEKFKAEYGSVITACEKVIGKDIVRDHNTKVDEIYRISTEQPAEDDNFEFNMTLQPAVSPRLLKDMEANDLKIPRLTFQNDENCKSHNLASPREFEIESFYHLTEEKKANDVFSPTIETPFVLGHDHLRQDDAFCLPYEQRLDFKINLRNINIDEESEDEKLSDSMTQKRNFEGIDSVDSSQKTQKIPISNRSKIGSSVPQNRHLPEESKHHQGLSSVSEIMYVRQNEDSDTQARNDLEVFDAVNDQDADSG